MPRIVAIVLLAVVLSGCATRPLPAPVRPSPVPSVSPAPTSAPAISVRGSGTLHVPGQAPARISIASKDSVTTLVFPAELQHDSRAMVVFYDHDVRGTACSLTGVGYYVFAISVGDTGKDAKDIDMSTLFPVGLDPTFLRSVAVVREEYAGCPTVIDRSELVWSREPLYTRLPVHDAGSRTHATGTLDEHGWYRVAAGDAWSAIAARFGITTDQLSWLNPVNGLHRVGSIWPNDRLNLDPQGRGDSWARVLAAGRQG